MGRRPSFALGEIRLGPLQFSNLGRRRTAAASRPASAEAAGMPDPDVAVRSRVRPAGPQAVQRIDDERQMARNRCRFFRWLRRRSVRRPRPRRESARPDTAAPLVSAVLALRVGLDHGAVVGHAVGRRGKIVRGENRLHAGHGQRLARVDDASRAHAARGSAAACRTACRRRESPRRTSPCRSPSRTGRGWCSSCRSVCIALRTSVESGLLIWARHGSPSSCSLRRASSR